MYHLKLSSKDKTMPLLSDILNFLFVAFNFILNQLKNFYSAEDKNIAFLTLFQAPMTNALNTGSMIASTSNFSFSNQRYANK